MSESDIGPGTHAVEHEALQQAAHAPMGRGPLEVLFGAGGDPLVFGLPVFVSGSLVLGFVLIGVFVPTATGFGTYLAITTFSTGLGELITGLWAIGLGQTIVATVFILFTAFWWSLFAMLVGIFHNWYAIPAASVLGTEKMFFLAWLIIFVFLTVGILRLPVLYPLIMLFVDLAVLFVLLALYENLNTDLLIAGGASVLAFCATGLYIFLEVAWNSTGKAKPLLPLGQPLWK